LVYLDKRWKYTGHDQHIGPHVPPLAQLHIRKVQHCPGRQASFGPGFRKIGACGGREQREEVTLLDEVLGKAREEVTLGGSAVKDLLAAKLGEYIMGAHADNSLIEG